MRASVVERKTSLERIPRWEWVWYHRHSIPFLPVSLYLKYRPRSFADVIGQEHIVTTLEHAVQRDQLVHAYLFFGPRGTGKTSVARILAKILLIRGLEDEILQQHVLRSIDEGNLVDLIEIDAATNRQIDDVRDLKEKVQFAPTMASAKVYIVDEVHMMTKEAFNALLKTLEEPPSHVYFILATTELHKVPETIQSRCQRFSFHQIGEEDIIRALQNIADKERITIERAALRAIARHVNGGMRDAVGFLDQLSSLGKITENDVRLRIGESADEYVEQLWHAVEARDRQGILTVTGALHENGVSLEVFLRQLLASARHDLHQRIAAKADTAPALEHIDAIFRALRDIRVAPVPDVALEVALLELCRDTPAVAEGRSAFSLGRVLEPKKTPAEPPVVNHAVSPRVPVTSSPSPAEEKHVVPATFVAEECTEETLRHAWEELLAALSSASLRMSLKDAVVQSMVGDVLTLAFSSNFHCERVMDPKATRELVHAIRERFHRDVRVTCVLSTGIAPPISGHVEPPVNIAEAVAEVFGR